MNLPDFIPGIELGRRFYLEVVRPILDAEYPRLPHAAARLGGGSDVLGFDTPMSRDHDWGPSVTLLLRDEDGALAPAIHELLRHALPRRFLGYAVGIVESDAEKGTLVMAANDAGPVDHRVYVTTVREFARHHLDYDIDQPPDAADWLTFPAQLLRALTASAVYHDDVGELAELRARLSYYPHEIWLLLLAAGWRRIAQEEHLMPRAGYTGDELGAALIGARLVRDIMSLCFLMEQVYAPYPKWFGTAFKQLPCAADLTTTLQAAQLAATWQEREAALVPAYEYIARLHNALGLTAPLPATVSSFFGRPFRVIWGDRFANALVAQITDPAVKRIATHSLIGSIDQFSDSTDLRADIAWRAKLRALYE